MILLIIYIKNTVLTKYFLLHLSVFKWEIDRYFCCKFFSIITTQYYYYYYSYTFCKFIYLFLRKSARVLDFIPRNCFYTRQDHIYNILCHSFTFDSFGFENFFSFTPCPPTKKNKNKQQYFGQQTFPLREFWTEKYVLFS